MKKEKTAPKKQRSLAFKTVYSTILSCGIFGLVALLITLAFYAFTLTKQYITMADGIARQSGQSVMHGADPFTISRQVMDRYKSLTPEQRNQVGTEEYRSYFADIDIGHGSDYDYLIHMITGTLHYYDIYDVYIGMYDRDTDALVYVVDPDPDIRHRQMPGDWETVDHEETLRFLESSGKGKLYDIGQTETYGLLCTVGYPLKDDAGETVAFMLVDLSMKNIVNAMKEFALMFTCTMIILTLSISWLQARRIKHKLVNPINRIAEASQRFASGEQTEDPNGDHFSALGIRTGDELEKLTNTMANMEHSLKEYGANLLKITSEKERISTELTLATKIQASMLPHTFPPYPNRHEFDIYAVMEPAREIGGDFYDFFLIDEDHLCLVIADVSGKGIPAALFMMISKTILQSCAMLGRSAADILTKTNEALCSNNQVEMFVTVWLGILEISTGRLSAANAGHEYPVIKRNGGVYELYKDKHGIAIGAMDGVHYKEYTLRLEPGDSFFLYTDGVPEATDAEAKMFGVDRLVDVLNQGTGTTQKERLTDVRKAVSEFVQDAEQFDDLTMLGFTYNGQ